jgi:carbon dioxide concentrating mechanism protein CcmO
VSGTVGFLETTGLTPAIAAIDAMAKSASVHIIQVEVNDLCGVCVKISGGVDAVSVAIQAGRRIAEGMQGKPVSHVIANMAPDAGRVIVSPREYNPLIQQEVVFQAEAADATGLDQRESTIMSQETSFALGLIETQGFTAVFEAIDTACKTASVEVIGKEKLGGGYVTVIIKGELSAVSAAVEAGKSKVGELGKLIAAHVIARPSEAVLSLLPKAS